MRPSGEVVRRSKSSSERQDYPAGRVASQADVDIVTFGQVGDQRLHVFNLLKVALSEERRKEGRVGGLFLPSAKRFEKKNGWRKNDVDKRKRC